MTGAVASTAVRAPEPDGECLDDVRRLIDRVDGRLVGLMARRVRLASRAGAFKRAQGTASVDHAREAAVVRRAAALAREAGLDDEGVRDVFWQLVRLSRDAQLQADGAGEGER